MDGDDYLDEPGPSMLEPTPTSRFNSFSSSRGAGKGKGCKVLFPKPVTLPSTSQDVSVVSLDKSEEIQTGRDVNLDNNQVMIMDLSGTSYRVQVTPPPPSISGSKRKKSDDLVPGEKSKKVSY